jgi:hypothetical protein
MGKLIDLTGQKFNKLLTVKKVGLRFSNMHWKFLCDCGGTTITSGSAVYKGRIKSCGCGKIIKKTHGDTKSLEYKTWLSMRKRCNQIKSISYKYYGGRGIKICDRWSSENGYQNFLADMGRKPTEKHTIDRIDVNGNYEPSNCRWATKQQQEENKRNSRNTSGCVGVSRKPHSNSWGAQINKQYLGCFRNKADAIARRKEAELQPCN